MAYEFNTRRRYRYQEHRRSTRLARFTAGPGHHDVEPRTVRSGDEPLASVDSPSGTRPFSPRLQAGGIRTCARCRLGHCESRPHVTHGKRTEVTLLLCLRGHLLQQMDVALNRRVDVEGHRPEEPVPGGLEDVDSVAHVESEPAVLDIRVRGENARFLGDSLEPRSQEFTAGRVHIAVVRIFNREDMLPHEFFGGSDNLRGHSNSIAQFWWAASPMNSPRASAHTTFPLRISPT